MARRDGLRVKRDAVPGLSSVDHGDRDSRRLHDFNAIRVNSQAACRIDAVAFRRGDRRSGDFLGGSRGLVSSYFAAVGKTDNSNARQALFDKGEELFWDSP
ncbi:hypothetical protein [Blastococcus brunescens]|uniref:Uncharacterized protein n=1 Tax=Blastococcus brunescens TaxID=1564165 RepID=A0ABZ1B5I6_9ACTN|nr:hypothetical protein [Blastococcus sp. BMG 8361]WRL64285.1 hypothetical protein U6N30_32895 [Blastococcus sp. BMG 8361]